MEQILKHTWELSEADAINLQQELSLKVIKEDHFAEINYVAGVDVAYSKRMIN